MTGQNIAQYRVGEKIGAGGMGEVYRARDTRLGRDVAVKVLPASFAGDAQRMARLEREAQVLASLNHANIAAVYGLEVSDGTRALVMELVEGPTLADRIGHGAVPLEEALRLALQVAEALEYAHDRGIIHRDLKPANIKVTPEGKVKLLDFGLAKALEDSPAAGDISNSPTISAVATRAGVILGTAAYMSPEQAKGKSVDRRADIWAFGVLLLEMLTGKRPYTGETASEVLAAVILKDADLTTLPGPVPARVRRLLQRCLTKDPKQRLQAIGEARIVLQEYLANPAAAADDADAGAAGQAQPAWGRTLPWAGAAIFFALLAAIALWRPWQPPRAGVPIRVSADVGANGALATEYGSAVALSPDGTRIANVVRDSSGKQEIFLRALDQLQATPLSGTEGARHPFFSPDGQWIAFFAGGKLKKISVQGGAAVALCDAADDRGGTWSQDGTIIFTDGTRAALSQVSSAGGTPHPVTSLDQNAGEVTQRWPQALPGGKAVLFTANTGLNFEDATLVVQELPSGERKTVHRGGFHGRYLPSGHLVFIHEGTLFAMPFDLKRLEATGQPAPVIERVVSSPGIGGAQFSFSDTGALTYVGGSGAAPDVSIYWMGRDGKMESLRQTPAEYNYPAFSPDGKRLALQIREGSRSDIWVYDWQRDTLTRLTFGGDLNTRPSWTPDGRRITYAMSEKGGPPNLYWKRADGSGGAERLSESKGAQYAGSWQPDGKVLAFFQSLPSSSTGWDIYTITMEGDEKTGWKPGEPKPFLNSPAIEVYPAFSPDGRWLAYMSNESGAQEIFVRPFPGPGGKWQVSSGGGRYPQWSPNGKELFYRTEGNKIMVVTYSASGDSFQATKPALWSEGQFADRGFNKNFALHPDGKRVAVFRSPGGEAQQQANKIVFVFNFFDELRQKLGAKQ